MKLERIQEYVLPVVATLGGIIAAILCGRLTGNGQIGTLAFLVLGSVAMVLILTLRQHIWVLIPGMWALQGQLPPLPLPFSIRDLVVATVFGAFLVFLALKIVRRKPRFELLDLCMLVMLLYLVTVFLRNPVGVNALGSEKVGGRPYFDVAIGIMAYWVLSRVHLPSWGPVVLPVLVMGTKLIEMGLNAIAVMVPRTAPILASVYTGVDPSTYEADNVWRGPVQQSSGRQMFLGAFGQGLALLCCSLWRPITLITPLYWGRFSLFVIALTLATLSGFRSMIVSIFAYMLVSSALRKGFREVLPLFALAIPALLVLIAVQGTVIDLPHSIQRSLSFLPGRWSQVARDDAKASALWRFEMWRIMLTEDKYIANKWLGDGFGFSQRHLEIMAAKRVMGDFGDQEHYMITGAVHSGPISTIRYVGYVGLALYIVLLSMLARRAWALVMRSKETPLFMVCLFICIPIIWEPFNFVFVFGGFEGALPQSLLALGMLKMLGNSLETSTEQPQHVRRTTPLKPLRGDRPLLPA